MDEQENGCTSNTHIGNSGGSKVNPRNGDDVPKIDSELVVLEFLASHEVPMQPSQIYGGLVLHQRITFSYRTLQNKIASLVEKGEIKRVKIDTGEGVVRDITDSDSGQRANYMITDAGKARVRDELDE